MCIFLSWLHYEGEDLFINDDILDTYKGKELIRHLDQYYWDDIPGHGALMSLHKMGNVSGDHIEVASFKHPTSFPKTILESINQCKFRKVGIPNLTGDMLIPKVHEAYDKQKTIEAKEYETKRAIINRENNKNIGELREIYRVHCIEMTEVLDNTCNKAYKNREKLLEKLFLNYNSDPLLEPRQEYLKKRQEIRDTCSTIEDKAMKKHSEEVKKSNPKDKIDKLFKKNTRETKNLHYAYKEKLVNRFWDLFEDKNNRTEIWRNII